MEIEIGLKTDDVAALKKLLADRKWSDDLTDGDRQILGNVVSNGKCTADTVTLVHHALNMATSNQHGQLRLHELIERSDVRLPALPVRERNPELEARCNRLRVEQADREYRDMTRNVDSHTAKESPLSEIGREVRAINRHLVTLFNMLFTVVGSFVFAYVSTQYFYPSGPGAFASRLGAGLITATVVFFADLYFVIKTLDEEAYEQKKVKK